MKNNKKKEKQKILEPIKDEKTKHQLIYGITGLLNCHLKFL